MTSEAIGSQLAETDIKMLSRSWITPELAEAAGLRRVTSAEGAQLVGRKGAGDFSGLAFPYFWPGRDKPREYILRLDYPELEAKADGRVEPRFRYLFPPGRSNILYIAPETTPEMLADTNLPIVFCEGIKKVLAVRRLATEGVDYPRFLPVAINGVWGWKGKAGIQPGAEGKRRQVKGPIPDLNRFVWKGRNVVILFDSDVVRKANLQDARHRLIGELVGRGADVRTIEPPDIEGYEKTGIDDFLAAYGPAAGLQLIENAKVTKRSTTADILKRSGLPELKPPAAVDGIESCLRRLAEDVKDLDALGRAALREAAMQCLTVLRIGAPARLLAPIFVLPEPEEARVEIAGDAAEWPEEVDGAALLDDMTRMLRRFLFLPSGAAETEALWIMHSHADDAFDISPYLVVMSPEKRCGKTLTLELVHGLVPRALMASNITPAALFRAVEKFRPTLLVDELDTFLREFDELRGILNLGHRRASAFVIRCVGEDNEPTVFSTWCPKVLARIGELPDTLTDRSIIIKMTRKTPKENVECLRLDRIKGELRDLRRQCARWAKDHLESLRAADPEVPDGLNDRAAENWRPLLAIADAAAGHWRETTRKICRVLSGVGDESQSIRVQLLADIRAIFARESAGAIPSQELVRRLVDLEECPWAEYRGGKPITAHTLARLLKSFGIRPGQCWIGKNIRGYSLDQFRDVFVRYLPPELLDPLDSNNDAGFSPFCEPLDGQGSNTSKKALEPNNDAGSSGSSTSKWGPERNMVPVMPPEGPSEPFGWFEDDRL